MLIYFGGPLFNEAERAFNAQLAAKLEERGFAVFLPQRDGFEIDSPKYQGMSMMEKQEAIFNLDRDKLLEADIFLFVLDGRVPDEGACVELGIAYAQSYLLGRPKYLVGLLTDFRIFSPGMELNAIIFGALDSIVDDQDHLIEELEGWRSSQQVISGRL